MGDGERKGGRLVILTFFWGLYTTYHRAMAVSVLLPSIVALVGKYPSRRQVLRSVLE